MILQVGNGVGPFVEKQIQDGQVGDEAETIAEDLRVGGLQSERIIGLHLSFGVDEQTKVGICLPGVVGGRLPVAVQGEEMAYGAQESFVECCQVGVFLFVEGLQRILII